MIRRNRDQQKGFSLLEVLVSMGIFSIGALALAQAFSTQLNFNTTSERKSGAMIAAQRVLDELRVSDPVSLPSSGTSSPQTVTVGGRNYSVTVSYCEATPYCTSGNIRVLKAEVEFQNRSVYTVETIYAQLR